MQTEDRFNTTPYTTIMISGGFDPVHSGHIRMIQDARNYGEVIVIVNSDAWLKRKKGYVFMPFEERCEIMEAFEGVTHVMGVEDDDDTVCEALKRVKPTYFGNGGDRTGDNTPEQDVCKELNIEVIFELGGEKTQSSSQLVDNIGKTIARDEEEEYAISIRKWFNAKYNIKDDGIQ